MTATPKIAVASALGAFYLWMAYIAGHPAVDAEYQAHFLHRTASCWVPKSARTAAALPASLRFGDLGYPDACRYLRLGWWDPEHWGVWSNGDKATLRLPSWPGARAVDLILRGSPEPGHTVRTRFALGGMVIEKNVPAGGTTTVRIPLPPDASQDDMRLVFSSYTVVPALPPASGKPMAHPMTRHVGVGLIAMQPIKDQRAL